MGVDPNDTTEADKKSDARSRGDNNSPAEERASHSLREHMTTQHARRSWRIPNAKDSIPVRYFQTEDPVLSHVRSHPLIAMKEGKLLLLTLTCPITSLKWSCASTTKSKSSNRCRSNGGISGNRSTFFNPARSIVMTNNAQRQCCSFIYKLGGRPSLP